MKLVCIIALLLCMVLAPVSVVAEDEVLETNAATVSLIEITDEADEMESSEPEIILEESPESEATSLEAARLFGLIHSRYLMAVEEAYGYLLLSEDGEKQAFYDEIAALKEDMAAFEAEIAGKEDEYPALTDGYEMASAGLDSMVAAAEQMFASYEETGSPVLEDVQGFEAEVEVVYSTLTWTWQAHSGRMPSHEEAVRRMLYNTLFAAAWEGYEYLIKADASDKEALLGHLDYFDTRLSEFEEKYSEESFADLRQAKEDLVEVYFALMTSVQEEGAPDMDLLQSLETVMEEIQDGRLNLAGLDLMEPLEMAEAAQSSDAASVDEEALETA